MVLFQSITGIKSNIYKTEPCIEHGIFVHDQNVSDVIIGDACSGKAFRFSIFFAYNYDIAQSWGFSISAGFYKQKKYYKTVVENSQVIWNVIW